MAAGRALTGYTIERQEGGVLKLEVIEKVAITAVTGAMGLAQRFNDQVTATIRELRQPFQASQHQGLIPGLIMPGGTPVQQILAGKVPPNSIPYDVLGPVELGRIIAQTTVADFQRTQSHQQMQQGWGLGALLAFINNDRPQLIDFDPTQFHPELKGLPDPLRGDQDRIWRCVSWGAGSKLADSFLAHVYRLLFGKKKSDESNEWEIKVPTIAKAKLAVAWTVDHVRRYNVGLVGGKLQLAVLEKRNGVWVAHYEDPEETEEQVTRIENYISAFGEEQQPEASKVDLDKVLSGEESI
jgi:hypothetical protein